jgi:hypothetical protein
MTHCSNPSSSRRLGIIGGGPAPVVLVPLLERDTITAISVGDSTWDQLILPCEALSESGPAIQDLVLHAEIRNLSGLFGFRVAIQRKFLDGDWLPLPASISSGDLLLGEQTADGYPAPSVFSDRSRLGMQTRLLLQYHARNTGAAGARADLSLTLAIRLFAS